MAAAYGMPHALTWNIGTTGRHASLVTSQQIRSRHSGSGHVTARSGHVTARSGHVTAKIRLPGSEIERVGGGHAEGVEHNGTVRVEHALKRRKAVTSQQRSGHVTPQINVTADEVTSQHMRLRHDPLDLRPSTPNPGLKP
eukprot:2578262-Rhodomonas_salina.4